MKVKDLKDQSFGYNEYACKSILAIAGINTTGAALAEILGIEQNSALRRFATGKFTRAELALIQRATNATPEQMAKAFFTGLPAKLMPHTHEERSDAKAKYE